MYDHYRIIYYGSLSQYESKKKFLKSHTNQNQKNYKIVLIVVGPQKEM